MTRPELAMVIPAYNEAKHLEEVLREAVEVFEAAHLDYQIRIVNNGSRDDTQNIIDRLARENPRIVGVFLKDNHGYGGGILRGLQDADATTVGWMHADGQTNPDDVVRLLKKMKSVGVELGKATRIERDETFWRKFQGALYFKIFQLLFRTPYHDVNATPKLMSARAYRTLELVSRDWFLDPEFAIKAMRKKMPVTEIDIKWRRRRSGPTRAHFLTGLEFLKNMLLYRLYVK